MPSVDSATGSSSLSHNESETGSWSRSGSEAAFSEIESRLKVLQKRMERTAEDCLPSDSRSLSGSFSSVATGTNFPNIHGCFSEVPSLFGSGHRLLDGTPEGKTALSSRLYYPTSRSHSTSNIQFRTYYPRYRGDSTSSDIAQPCRATIGGHSSSTNHESTLSHLNLSHHVSRSHSPSTPWLQSHQTTYAHLLNF